MTDALVANVTENTARIALCAFVAECSEAEDDLAKRPETD